MSMIQTLLHVVGSVFILSYLPNHQTLVEVMSVFLDFSHIIIKHFENAEQELCPILFIDNRVVSLLIHSFFII